jgi:hypothetical protein
LPTKCLTKGLVVRISARTDQVTIFFFPFFYTLLLLKQLGTKIT